MTGVMTVTINGQARELPAPLTIAELLQRLETSPRGKAVEVNEQIVPRSQHGEHYLTDGDKLEIVSLVGGG
jgi:sulfur carrier protein